MDAPPSPPAPADAPASAGAAAPSSGPVEARGAPHYLRAFLRALTDEGTFNLRQNPPLWLGFVLAIPLPLLMFAVHAPLWIRLLAIFSPLAWAVILGAAGRVGILAQQEQERLAEETRRARAAAEQAHEALDAEVLRREELEKRQKEVLNELKLAQAVQSTLVPANILRPEAEVAVRHIPSAYVGGDYLHANLVDGRYLYLCVADVSGHGVSAALVVARLHGLVRRITLEKQHPESMLDQIHRAALHIFQHTYFFLTVGVFRLDLADGTLDYATAGHPGQVLLRADGALEILRTPNRLLGMDADVFDSERPSDRTRLKPGDTLVLFTDGLFEILSGGDGAVLGESGLRQRISGLAGLAPTLMAGEILQELANFQGRSTFEDDVSLMVARFQKPLPRTPPASSDSAPDTGPVEAPEPARPV